MKMLWTFRLELILAHALVSFSIKQQVFIEHLLSALDFQETESEDLTSAIHR